jgi:hypothetical protein
MEHPDFPEQVDEVQPCPRCHEVPDFSQMPRGSYRYVRLEDHSVVCQLHVPLDPLIVPYIGRPVIAHACGPVMDRAKAAQDQMQEHVAQRGGPLVVEGAEAILRQHERQRGR